MKNFLKYVPTIHPDGKFILFWNLFTCFCILYQFLAVSVELFFDYNWDLVEPEIIGIINKRLTDSLKYLLLVDVFMNMTTGYFHKGGIVMKPKKILNKYFREQLIIDLLIIIPTFIPIDEELDRRKDHFSALSYSKASVVRLLIAFRLFKLARNYNHIEITFSNDERIEGLLALLKLFFKLLFIAHILSCFWFFLGNYFKKKGSSSWLDKIPNECADCDWRSYYLYSIYWAITTMVSVGYGDITPSNIVETSFVISSMIVGCGMFGYSINNIGAIFERYFSREKEKR